METFKQTPRQIQISGSNSNEKNKFLQPLGPIEKAKLFYSSRVCNQKAKNSTFVNSYFSKRLKNQSKWELESFQPIKTDNKLSLCQNTFRNTISFTDQKKNRKSFLSQKKKKKNIEIIMKENKQIFSLNLRRNISKLNSSFINCIQNKRKETVNQHRQLRLSEQQSMSIQMQTKSNKSILLKGVSGFNFRKFPEKISYDDVFVKENNVFSISIESRKCMDGIFPMFRSGHTLCSRGESVYVFGGINSKLCNAYHFNEFKGSQREWICLKNEQQFNYIIPSFHSVQTFKDSILFIGGSTINEKSSSRLYNLDILVFDTQNQQFSKIKWNIKLRSHASTIYSNMVVVYGGINQNNQFSNILYFLPLNSSKISQTNPVPYNMGTQGEGVAFHKMVNTFQIDTHLKKKLQMDGIICYGGKFADGSLNEEILLFRFNKNKESTQTQRIIKGWQTVRTHGTKPQARSNHSMDILINKCICLVIGGMNWNGQVLNDAWILDLMSSTWTKAIFDNRYQILERGIFSHATTIMNGELFVFGGLTGQNKISNDFWSVDFTYNRAARKQEELKRTRSQIGTSHGTIRNNQLFPIYNGNDTPCVKYRIGS